MRTCTILAREPTTCTSIYDTDCLCTLEPVIVGELALLAQPNILENPFRARQDIVAEVLLQLAVALEQLTDRL